MYLHKLFWMSKTISVHNMFSPCSELGIFMHWTCNSMNNLLLYFGLVDAKIRASDKDLPVQQQRPWWRPMSNPTLSAYEVKQSRYVRVIRFAHTMYSNNWYLVSNTYDRSDRCPSGFEIDSKMSCKEWTNNLLNANEFP